MMKNPNYCGQNRGMYGVNQQPGPAAGAPSARQQGCPGPAQQRCSALSARQLMKQVMLCGFACTEASLYLDTHPEDPEALSYYKEQNRLYQDAVEEYSRTYGPLTLAHAHHCGAYWNWVNQPWPWQ